MAPKEKWVYFATGVDAEAKQHFGFYYYPNGGNSPVQILKSRSDNFYSLNHMDTTFNLGGMPPDFLKEELPRYGSCFCTMQHVRIFLDYIPKTSDEFLNTALMEPGSNNKS